ncbi:MAG: sigma-70 family RNA polymerase sigma factor [Alphaproteobacteria bacterium]|nr:sigma-70 family RNA polymerase sigma factor [Alphaproteobacteria bacterium]
MESHHDFERLALPQMEAAYNIAYWIVRSAPDAEDVVQDAYLRAYRAFDSWAGKQSPGGDIRPWLFTIVRNRAYQLLSQRKRRANVVSIEDAFASRDDDGEVREPPSDDRSAEEILIRSAEQAVVRSALERLPQIFREVIVLREWEELSYQAIAEVVGVPIGTVMSRLARGRDLLGRHLAQLSTTETTHVV